MNTIGKIIQLTASICCLFMLFFGQSIFHISNIDWMIVSYIALSNIGSTMRDEYPKEKN